MKLGRLVRAGLWHHRRTHLGVLAGVAVATATLTGALVVGDSVRGTLARRASERIGAADLALLGGDRVFRPELADALADEGDRAAAVLMLPGVLSTADRSRRVHDVGVLGVDARFFELSPAHTAQRGDRGDAVTPPAPGQGLLSEELARRLDVDVGARLVLRVDQPSAIPRDMALAPDDVTQAVRIEVAGVVGDEDLGSFALFAGHQAPANLFVDRDWLGDELELSSGGGRANVLLVDVAGELAAGADAVRQRLSAAWSLADASLAIAELDADTSELSTERIFFDDAVVDALEAARDVELGGVFTYFVNALRAGQRSTPYSMVTGLGALAGELPAGWEALRPAAPDGIVCNRWLADDLALEPGARLELDYWTVAASGRLVERSSAFTVERIVELAGAAADPAWMPDFPGLADADSCRDWEPGTPVDLDRIRDVDEDYWDEWRGTPKAFITLERARELWHSRFGALSAVRFAPEAEPAVRALLRRIDPASIGLELRDLRTPAEAASASPTDFGGLFLGLSFFLIVAALLLTAQLFLFGVESRASELGLLSAVGFTRRRVARAVLLETTAVAALGALVGLPLGLAYTRAMIFGLTSAWAGAVAGVELDFHVEAGTLALGYGCSMLATFVAVGLALRRQLREPTIRLTARRGGVELRPSARAGGRPPILVAVLCCSSIVAAAALVVAFREATGTRAAGAFFGAGALLLVAGLTLARAFLRRPGADAAGLSGIAALGRRNARRRPGRSLATVALMAIGTFLVLAVGVHRIGPTPPTTERSAGTGGFAFYGRTSLAVAHDLDTPAGRDFFALPEDALRGVDFIPLRVRSGDDASCLNLARPSRPRLLGVDPDELARRRAFSFAATIEEVESPWTLLSAERADGAIPAIGDTTSLTWQLKKGIGDRIEYRDEHGRTFEVVIVAALADTVLQGDLIIATEHFEERYPTEGGHRRFLVDAPLAGRAELRATLERALADVGLSLEPTAERLDAFHAVQNTYLTIFELLGALGVLLGGVGLGAVSLRNGIERRSELALCAALGFRARAIRRLVVSEHAFLLLLGAAVGGGAALAAVLPAAGAGEAAVGRTLWTIAAIGANGFLWILLAARSVDVRAPDLVLREE